MLAPKLKSLRLDLRAAEEKRKQKAKRKGWNSKDTAIQETNLRIRQKVDGTVFVDGLTCRKVDSEGDMQSIFREVCVKMYNAECSFEFWLGFYESESSR